MSDALKAAFLLACGAKGSGHFWKIPCWGTGLTLQQAYEEQMEIISWAAFQHNWT